MDTNTINRQDRTARVLVVDDIPDNVKLLGSDLEDAGYEVLIACSSREALTVAQKELPDVILLDTMMPEIDGFEVCRRLKADEELQHIPVIMVSTDSNDDEIIKGLDVGAQDFVTKPFSFPVVAARVRSAVRVKKTYHLEKVVKQAEARFRVLFESTGDAIMMLDETGFFACNPATLSIFGVTTEENFCSLHPADLSPARQPDGVESLIAANARIETAMKEGSCRFDWMHKRYDTKKDFPAEVLLTAMELDGRQVLQATVRDITERKQAENALRESESKYRILFSQIADAILIFEKETLKFLDCNDAVFRIYGYTLDEIKSMTILDLHPPKDQEKVKRNVNVKNINIANTYTHVTKDRRVLAVEIITNEIEYQGRQAWISIVRDITERMQAEQEVKKLSAAIRQSPVVVVITDSRGNIEYVNPKFTQLTGYSAEEVLGKNPRVLQGGEVSKKEYTKLWRTILAGKEWRGEFHNKKKNGELFWEQAYISAIFDENGKITNFMALKEDITERKQASEALSEAKKAAEAANIAKSEFLANMSHEIRTPMNGVMGMTGLLLDTELTEEQRDFTETIERSSEALLTIINDILDFSKIEAGKLAIEPIPFDLKVAVLEVAGLLTEKAAEKKTELKVRYVADTPTRLIGDPGRIRQIIINLAGNAIKFTEEGQVSINVEHLDLTENDVKLKISIKDSGIGIPKDKLDHIFKKFSQADATTTRKFGGTGLGLAISKQLVELMNGEIDVSSEPGKGSTFTFVIPLPLDKQNIIEPAPIAELKEVKFLIVEDNQTDKKVIQEQFKNLGLGFDCYESGAEVLTAMRRAVAAGQPYQVAIIDYLLPEMDGETLARTIKADSDLKDTALVMLTSATKKGDAKRFKKAGFTAFLTKPIRPALFMDTLAMVWVSHVQGKSTELITSHSVIEACAARADVKKPRRQARSLRILLAEDNIINQKVAVKMLQKLNCRVDVAANGKEAVEMVQAFPYELLFMDCQMPELNGYEATAVIRKWESEKRGTQAETRRMPIIAMTANAMQGDREECLKVGMDDYISKPVNSVKLQEVLEKWIQETTSDDEHSSQIVKIVDTPTTERYKEIL